MPPGAASGEQTAQRAWARLGVGQNSDSLIRVGKSFACFRPVLSGSPEEINKPGEAVAGTPVRILLWAGSAAQGKN